MSDIRYIEGNEEILDRIEPLWKALNAIHLEKSVHFKEHYTSFTFAARKKALLSAAEKGRLLALLACVEDQPVGYCVASAVDGEGEVDSLYVCEEYRRKGVAKNLMERALAWLEQSGAGRITLKVSVGNEEVLGFYARFGFFPRLAELQRTKKQC